MRTVDLEEGIIGTRVPARHPLDGLPMWEAAKQDDDALAAAERARTLAIQQAHDHANETWKQAAYSALVEVARKCATFTACDVWAHLKGAKPTTHEPSALGPLFLIAARKGICAKTGRYVRPVTTTHHRDVAEWASCILDQGA